MGCALKAGETIEGLSFDRESCDVCREVSAVADVPAAPVPVNVPAVKQVGNFIEVTIQIPVSEPTGFIAVETDRALGTSLKIREATQQLGMRVMHQGLHDSHAQLANSRHVDSLASAFCWLCEQIGAAYQKATSDVATAH